MTRFFEDFCQAATRECPALCVGLRLRCATGRFPPRCAGGVIESALLGMGVRPVGWQGSVGEGWAVW